MAGSAIRRTQQWATFSRVWHLYDAKWQNPYKSGDLIAKYLKGKHKPIFLDKNDCGDHVIVYNSYYVALPGAEWERRLYFHHTGYAGGATYTMAHELHRKDNTMIMKKAVYTSLGNNLMRRPRMARLHIFPYDKIPSELMKNVTSQIRQLREIPKRLEEYSPEEVEKFPKLFDWPEDHIIR